MKRYMALPGMRMLVVAGRVLTDDKRNPIAFFSQDDARGVMERHWPDAEWQLAEVVDCEDHEMVALPYPSWMHPKEAEARAKAGNAG